MENLLVINHEESLLSAMNKIELNKKNFLICVDEMNVVKGVVTDGDIRRFILSNLTVEASVKDAMTVNSVTCSQYDDFGTISEKFRSRKIKFLSIVDDQNRLLNVITKDQFHTMLLEDIRFDLMFDFTIFDDYDLEHEIHNRPWGFYKSTLYAEHAQSKVITVFPMGELSLQEHKHREEHWVIIKGAGKVILGESILDVYPGKYIFIPKGCKHQLINESRINNLLLCEVQLGEYFGEDDILRHSDKYNRS